MFKARNKPFVLVFWSRDPDGTQHNQGDSLNKSSPASTARPRSPPSTMPTTISRSCAQALDELGLAATHRHRHRRRPRLLDDLEGEQDQPGRARRTTRTCRRASCRPASSRIDLAKALGAAAVRSRRQKRARRRRQASEARQRPDRRRPGKARCRRRVQRRLGPRLHLPDKDRRLTAKVVDALLAQDYVSGLFVDDELGPFPGTLPLSAHQPEGRGRHAASVDRRQFPLLSPPAATSR